MLKVAAKTYSCIIRISLLYILQSFIWTEFLNDIVYRVDTDSTFQSEKKDVYLHSRKFKHYISKKNYPRKRGKYTSVWYTSSLLMIYKVVERDQRDLVSKRVNNDRINVFLS